MSVNVGVPQCPTCGVRNIQKNDFQPSKVPDSGDIMHLLFTNTPPPSERVSTIRQCIEENVEAYRIIEEEIRRTQEYLRSLEDKKESLHLHVQNQKSMVNPVRRVPGDIWAQVFSHCVDPDPFLEVMDFYALRVHNNNVPSLSRHSLLGILSLHSERWKYLRVDGVETHQVQAFFTPIKPSLPILHTLVLRHLPITSASEVVCDIFANAPALRYVSLYDYAAEPLQSIVLPYSQLERLTLDVCVDTRFRVRDALAILRQAAPTILSFVIGYHFGVDSNPGSLVELPHLDNLVVSWGLPGMVDQEEDALRGVQQLLGHLVLPELIYFVDLGNTLGDTTSLDIWTISSLFERSKCPLYLLTLHIWVDDEELVRFMRTIPSTLTHLNLTRTMADDGRSFTDEFVSALQWRDNEDTNLFPGLESLTLKGDMSFDAAIFVNMVESRWVAESVCDLERVELDCEARPSNIVAFDRFTTDWNLTYGRAIDWRFDA
ncbi:hypothetical protein VNI00_008712 [Paramarasmius palmivorus]|uniref:F-box domain-containing protein n=1 Tax=Paramarasmius palmivorus TaxID=297713 RepID=A0AAW0CXL9_9AGAR